MRSLATSAALGSRDDVLLAIAQRDGRTVVTKRSGTPDGRQRLRAEGERLRRARHPGVVDLLACEDGAEETCLILAYAGTCSLAVPAARDAAEIAAVIATAATTLADLHELGIVHGRIQASHVVIDPAGRPVLAGFGPGAGDAGDGGLRPHDDVEALAELLGVLATRSAEDLDVATGSDGLSRRRPGARRPGGSGRRARRARAAVEELAALADRTTASAGDHGPTARQFAAAVLALAPGTRPVAGHAPPAERTRAEWSATAPADRANASRTGRPAGAHPDPTDRGEHDLGLIDRSFFEVDPLELAPTGFARATIDVGADADDLAAAEPGVEDDPLDGSEPDAERSDPRPPRRSGLERVGAAPHGVAPSRAPQQRPRRGGRLAIGMIAMCGMGALVLLGRHGDRPTLDPVEALVPTTHVASGGFDPTARIDPNRPVGPPEMPEPEPGAAPVRVYTNGVVELHHQRFAIGGPGDEIAVGDFGCRGAVTAVVLRPASGEVFVFDDWAGPGHDVQVGVAAVLPPDSHWQTASPGSRCAALVARLADHTTVTMPWPLPAGSATAATIATTPTIATSPTSATAPHPSGPFP